MAKFNTAANLREQGRRSFREKQRMIEKHYGSWTEYDNQRIRYDTGRSKSYPTSPEEYLRKENPYSGY